MKSFTMIMILLCSAHVYAANGSASMEVATQIPLVAKKAFSCVAQKNGDTVPDVDAHHFALDKFSVRNDSNETLTVSFVRVSVSGLSHPYVCEYAGEALIATGLPEAIPNDAVGTVSCPLYCGGVLEQKAGVYPAAVEVYGYFEDKIGNQSPLKIRKITEVLVR